MAASNEDVAAWLDANASISMCHRDTLSALSILAVQCTGAIVEFGPYIGGTTVALSRGASTRDAHVITVEKGGAYDHPRVPSTDILADLEANLDKFGFGGRVTIIDEFYQNVSKKLAAALDGEKIGLLVVDADGHVDAAFEAVSGLLAEDAVIVVDDYLAPFAPEKETLTKPVIDSMIDDGRLTDWGLLSGVTWIGQYGKHDISIAGDDETERVAPVQRSVCKKLTDGKVGHMVGFDLPDAWTKTDDKQTNNHGSVLVSEDGKLIGPPHSSLMDIVDYGRGAYSHWENKLWMSTSDNSDPATNNRTYEVRRGKEHIAFKAIKANARWFPFANLCRI